MVPSVFPEGLISMSRTGVRPSSRTISIAAGPRGDYLLTWEGFTAGNRAADLGIAARRVPSSQPEVPLKMAVTFGAPGLAVAP